MTTSLKNELGLQKIFCYLVDDPTFLLTIIDETQESVTNTTKSVCQAKINLMASIIQEYDVLKPSQTVNYHDFPPIMKKILLPEYQRLGIKNTMERNLTIINISFLNSFNILLRPDIYYLGFEDQMKNLQLFESFLSHTLSRNYQIDKIKKTAKIKLINKQLNDYLVNGKISHELIQYIVNVFEINLIVFDLSKSVNYLYWTHGVKYPFFNTFKNIFFMTYVNGNYEPIMLPNNYLSSLQKTQIYINILENSDELATMQKIKIDISGFLHINEWNLNSKLFIKILREFYHQAEYNLELDYKRIDALKIK
jgi:hypothetical protein